MFVNILILVQIISTLQQSYDEDIDVAYPIKPEYRFMISPTELIYLEINNCPCKTVLGIELMCFGNKCVTFPSAINVTIKILKIKLTAISGIEKDDLQSVTELEALEVEANVKLVKISPGCFRDMFNLYNLTINSNINLKYLEPNVFEGLINLKILRMKQNGFDHVLDATQALARKYLPNIILLDMSENMFHEINSNDFFPMFNSSLNELNLVLCEIVNISPVSLIPLRNLTDLRLGQNLFNKSVITDLVQKSVEFGVPLDNLNLYQIGLRKTIPNELMTEIGKSNITRICLAGNHFDYIDDNSFPFMSRLLLLDLRDNLIVEITLSAFKLLPNLKYLLLGANKLSSVPEATTSLNTVQLLDLAGNSNDGYYPSYFTLQNCQFKNMSSLDNLQLSYNMIGTLTSKSFKGLTNLTILNLKNTSISYIEPDVFLPLTNLKHLNLINNPFPAYMVLSSDIFKGLTNLQILLLGGCTIKNLTGIPSIFSYMPNLTYLGLERNFLHSLPSYQLLPLTKLKTINLDENKLVSWSKRMFTQSSVKVFFAQQNKISYATRVMLEDWQNLDMLYLDGNPFSCDCTLYPVVEWLRTHYTTIKIDKSHDVAKCLSPAKWRKKSVIEFLKNLTQNHSQCEQSNANILVPIFASVFPVLLFLICCCSYRWYKHHKSDEHITKKIINL